MEVLAFDFLEEVERPETVGKGPRVQVERLPVQFLVGSLLLDMDGARNLIAALAKLVEAVEEGTR